MAGLSCTFLQMGATCDATRISLCSKLNRRDRVSGMIFNFPDQFVFNREIVRLKRDCPSCKHIRCILHGGIQVTKSAVIHNTNEMATPFITSPMSYGDPIYRVSNEVPLALLIGIIFELPSNAVDLS